MRVLGVLAFWVFGFWAFSSVVEMKDFLEAQRGENLQSNAYADCPLMAIEDESLSSG